MKVTILIGNIGSGKSTYIKKFPDAYIVSRDDIRYMLGNGKYLYDEKFEDTIKYISYDVFDRYQDVGLNHIIIDETNMTEDSRYYYISKNQMYLPEYRYEVEAIVFKDYGEDEHVRRRLQSNHGDTDEMTWREVYRGLKETYEPPTKEEGFDIIRYE